MRPTRSRLVAATLCASVLAAACGDDDAGPAADAAPAATTDVGLVYDASGLSDRSLSDEVLLHLADAEDELGITLHAVQTDDTGSDRADLLRVLAGDGAGLVIGVGPAFGPAVAEVAPDYADTTFVLLDGTGPDLTNVVSLEFADEEAGYLAGAIAALSTTTGRVGFLGVGGDERSTRAQAGFTVGALRVDEAMGVDVAHAPPAATGGVDAAEVHAAATGLFDGGANVVYAAPGAASDALIAAAAQRGGVRVIGADLDRAELVDPSRATLVLTSTLKVVAGPLLEVIRDHLDADLDPGVRSLGVAEGAVSVVTPGQLLPAAVGVIDELVAALEVGQIQVPRVP